MSSNAIAAASQPSDQARWRVSPPRCGLDGSCDGARGGGRLHESTAKAAPYRHSSMTTVRLGRLELHRHRRVVDAASRAIHVRHPTTSDRTRCPNLLKANSKRPSGNRRHPPTGRANSDPHIGLHDYATATFAGGAAATAASFVTRSSIRLWDCAVDCQRPQAHREWPGSAPGPMAHSGRLSQGQSESGHLPVLRQDSLDQSRSVGLQVTTDPSSPQKSNQPAPQWARGSTTAQTSAMSSAPATAGPAMSLIVFLVSIALSRSQHGQRTGTALDRQLDSPRRIVEEQPMYRFEEGGWMANYHHCCTSGPSSARGASRRRGQATPCAADDS